MSHHHLTSREQGEAERLADFILLSQGSCILNLSPELTKAKISYPQFFLLTYLASEEFLAMSDIAKKMGHTTAAATGLVDRLQKLGFVERKQASDDRRRIIVRITQEGVEVVAKMRGTIAQSMSAMMAEMDSEEASTVKGAQRVLDLF